MIGQLTFDAEGQEGGPYHSRRFHVPTSSSGLTVGRGYDMKKRSKREVQDDMVSAGLTEINATKIARSVGLSGSDAEEFMEENDLEDFEISKEAQLKLFEIEYARQTRDTKRLATKADVTRAYGLTDWGSLNSIIQEVLVDLRFRGDYTPTCRRFLQIHVANNDLEAFTTEISDTERWPNVPPDRFQRRVAYCNAT